MGEGKRDLDSHGGKKDVHLYIRSIRGDECDVSWPDHERIRIMIHYQSLHIEFSPSHGSISRYFCLYETDIHNYSPRLALLAFPSLSFHNH